MIYRLLGPCWDTTIGHSIKCPLGLGNPVLSVSVMIYRLMEPCWDTTISHSIKSHPWFGESSPISVSDDLQVDGIMLRHNYQPFNQMPSLVWESSPISVSDDLQVDGTMLRHNYQPFNQMPSLDWVIQSYQCQWWFTGWWDHAEAQLSAIQSNALLGLGNPVLSVSVMVYRLMGSCWDTTISHSIKCPPWFGNPVLSVSMMIYRLIEPCWDTTISHSIKCPPWFGEYTLISVSDVLQVDGTMLRHNYQPFNQIPSLVWESSPISVSDDVFPSTHVLPPLHSPTNASSPSEESVFAGRCEGIIVWSCHLLDHVADLPIVLAWHVQDPSLVIQWLVSENKLPDRYKSLEHYHKSHWTIGFKIYNCFIYRSSNFKQHR